MTMSVEMSNLGPLRSARADLADLTVLVGKNNTGKTFFATVLHRVLNASSPLHLASRSLRKPPAVLKEWIENQIQVCLDQENGKVTPLENPSRDVLEWINSATDSSLKMFGHNVRNDIEYAFGVEASELRHTASRHSRNCFLRINHTNPDWEVKIRFDSNDINTKGPEPNYWLSRIPGKIQKATNRIHRLAQIGGLDVEGRFTHYESNIYRSLLSDLYKSWPRRAIHFPAGRTGIMQSYQILAEAAVRQAAVAGIRPVENESLPGTSADFLSLLINLRSGNLKRKKTSPIMREGIEKLEKNLGALIKLDRNKESGDMIVAVTPEGEFPMSRTSSMLSELAPMLLALKNNIGKGDHITIDEPESHLHPEMQRTVASFLVDMVNCGIGVALTTHSDFFLGQLNNAIRTDKLEQSISASLFTRGDRGCINEPLSIDPIDAIDESTFTIEMEKLYNETADIVDALLIKTNPS